MQRRAAGLCVAPSLPLGLLYRHRTPWRFAGGQAGWKYSGSRCNEERQQCSGWVESISLLEAGPSCSP